MYFDTYSPALRFFVETTSQFDSCIHSEEAWGGVSGGSVVCAYVTIEGAR